MNKTIELTKELMIIFYRLGYLVEHKNKKSFKIISCNELMCDVVMVSNILKENIDTYNISNIMLGKHSLQDLFSYKVNVVDSETITIEIFNLQSFRDKIKFNDIFDLVNTAGE